MSIHVSTGRSADSKETTISVNEPSPAPFTANSTPSTIRTLAGNRPAWAMARTAPAAWTKSGKRKPAVALNLTRPWTLTQASVMTPSDPSDPMSSRSGLGPAPDPGSRRDSILPAGVTMVTFSTRSSMWVYRVAKWPPERVAIQPPRVECWKDWGK